MMAKMNSFYALPVNLKKFISRWWFEYISKIDTGSDMLFINYGYTNLNPVSKQPTLQPEDEKNRYSSQLYHHLAENINWQGLDALEVGCGRGGGTSYIMRYFQPKSMVGIDITSAAIKFCNQYYAVDGLSFEIGDAEVLQFPDNSKDVILNVESSGNYPNIEKFFSEVVRVLKPNGYFLYADLRPTTKVDDWHKQMKRMELKVIKEEIINDNVVMALELDNERKRKLIQKYSPKILYKTVDDFAGMQGSNFVYGALKTKQKIYKSFVFQK